MSIASEITRLQGVKSDILQAIANKGVTVPAGSALDDCPALIASISVGNTLFREQIKDNLYTYVKIGNRYFTIDNLKEDFPGVLTSYNYGNAYRLNVVGYEIFGFFYNSLAVDIIKQWLIDNNSSWRIATKEDFLSINSYEITKLKVPVVWNNPIYNNNATGFNCMGSGYYLADSHRQLNENAYFITTTKEDNKYYYAQISDNNDINLVVTNRYYILDNSWPIRLVKDA